MTYLDLKVSFRVCDSEDLVFMLALVVVLACVDAFVFHYAHEMVKQAAVASRAHRRHVFWLVDEEFA